MFRLPLKERLVEGCVCDVSIRDDRAELLEVFTWDEMPSTHRFCVEALDRTLRDLTCVNRPFGGNTILLCGDWRQTGPIVPFGADADVVQAFLISSPLSGKLQRRHLTLPQRDQDDPVHAHFVRKVGENRVPPSIIHGNKTIRLTQTIANADCGPTYLIDHVNDIDELIAFVYPDLACDAQMFEKRAILAMTNVGIDGINDSIIQRQPGRMHTL